MIAFEVRLNGKRMCIAGAEDLAVLSAHVSAVGRLGVKSVWARPDEDTVPHVFYSDHGLTARPNPKKNVHLRWKSISALVVGDVVEIKVLETKKTVRPKSRIKAERKRA
jgi:hypothetical protein